MMMLIQMCWRLKCPISTIPYFHSFISDCLGATFTSQKTLKNKMALFQDRLELPSSRLVSHHITFHGLSLSDGDGNVVLVQTICFSLWVSVTAPSPSRCVCLRTSCPHLPSPQTRSSAGSNVQSSPARSPGRCLVNVKIISLLPLPLK